MSPKAAGADMRGFDWRLAALERKLRHALDRAQAELARLQREALGLEAARDALAKEKDAQARWASTLLARAMDPFAYRRCLDYLCAAERMLQERSAQAAQLETRVAAARQACLDADRRLAALCSLRDGAEADYALAQSRRGAKHADLAWLALASGVRARAAKREGVPR
jgi:DNA repair exonuclease SbcCD ATPase subunit